MPSSRSKGQRTRTSAPTTTGKVESTPAKTDVAKDDVMLVHSKTADGEGAVVLRKKGEDLSIGEVRPLKEGQPVHGDVVRLEQREEHPALFDVHTELEVGTKTPSRAHAGPARVASGQYRAGWESLWGRGRRRKKRAN